MINKEKLQAKLEKKALELNKGLCYSYNICKYCKAKGRFMLDSDTPCAEAFIAFKKENKDEEFKTENPKRIKKRKSVGIKQTWKNWEREILRPKGIEILDPDGFRDKPKYQKYTLEEFNKRSLACTLIGRAKKE